MEDLVGMVAWREGGGVSVSRGVVLTSVADRSRNEPRLEESVESLSEGRDEKSLSNSSSSSSGSGSRSSPSSCCLLVSGSWLLEPGCNQLAMHVC